MGNYRCPISKKIKSINTGVLAVMGQMGQLVKIRCPMDSVNKHGGSGGHGTMGQDRWDSKAYGGVSPAQIAKKLGVPNPGTASLILKMPFCCPTVP